MNDDSLKNKIETLESELERKHKEISEHIDKIQNLEDTIMEIEATVSNSDKEHNPYLQFRIREMEKSYRELKDKISLLKLENIRLKQNLDEAKKNPILIPVMEEKTQAENTKNTSKLSKQSDDIQEQEENIKQILIVCPECANRKSLKVPLKVINQSENVTTISVPSGIVCKHNFQVFVDKFFAIRGYQLADFEFPRIEYYESSIGSQGINNASERNLPSSPQFQEIINVLRKCVDNREILGSAIFTIEGRVLYTSIPQKTLFNTIREFEIRNEKHVHSVIKMFLELKNQQKVCSENLEIQGIEFILVLVFSKNVNFGIGNMLLKDVVKQLKALS